MTTALENIQDTDSLIRPLTEEEVDAVAGAAPVDLEIGPVCVYDNEWGKWISTYYGICV